MKITHNPFTKSYEIDFSGLVVRFNSVVESRGMILLMKNPLTENQISTCVCTIRPEAQADFRQSLQLAENERLAVEKRLGACA